jgi:hypothetical protein
MMSISSDDSDSPFLPELEVLEYGAVLIGVDDRGIAHVVMPLKNEVVEKKED